MLTKNLFTGEYVEATWTSAGMVERVLTESELNALQNKPTFTSIKPSEEDDDDESFSKDLARIGFGAVEGIAELGSDIFVRPFAEDKKEYDESYIEWRGEMAEYVPGLDREDIIDVETGKVLRPETSAGKVADVASWFIGGGIVFKALGKINKLRKAPFTKGIIAEQAVEQV